MEIKLSLIIPVFNVEKYIKECLDSIICQADDRVEIILVNDGSQDSSGTLCDDYAKKYNRIKVLHKENGGLSSARNAGLDVAQGEYVCFVDGDDRINKNCLKVVFDRINSSTTDIFFMQCVKFYPDGKTLDMGDEIKEKDLEGKTKNQILEYISTRPKFTGSACTKIYRRGFLVTNGLKFPLDSRFSEDLGFVADCIVLAEEMKAMDVEYYEYRQNREGSITDNFSLKKFNDLMLFVKETKDKANLKKNLYERRALLSFAAYEYSILVWRYSFLDKKDKKEVFQDLKKEKKILKDGLMKNTKKVKYLVSTLGLRIASKILKKYLVKR